MKKSRLVLLIAAGVMAAGLILALIGFMGVGRDFGNLTENPYVTTTRVVKEPFSDIRLDAGTSDVRFERSDSGECRVVCTEDADAPFSAAVKDGVLVIEDGESARGSRNWYETLVLGPAFSGKKVTVYLPEQEYRDLQVTLSTGSVQIGGGLGFETGTVQTNTGDVSIGASEIGSLSAAAGSGEISLDSVSSGSVSLAVTTGDVRISSLECSGDVQFSAVSGSAELRDVACAGLQGETDTGDIRLSRTVASGEIQCECGTGTIRLTDSDAASLKLRTTTGDIAGTILTEKIFLAKSNSGDVDFPLSTAGGTCEAVTNSGDIQLSVAGKS